MSNNKSQLPVLRKLYDRYLTQEDSAAFIKTVSQRYTIGALQRLAENGDRESRRAAILALGFIADYDMNAVLGRALNDPDRGVRLLAENGIRQLWRRDGSPQQRKKIKIIIRLNTSDGHDEALEMADELLQSAPWFAEAWNQRAIALYHMKRYEESAAACHQTLELNPYHFAAAAGMGQCLLDMKEPLRAEESFARALKLNPGLEGVRARLGQIRRRREEEREGM